MSSEPVKTGLIGGTFDPVHLGHIHIAYAALREYSLDEVWFMPAGDPYFKKERHVTPAGTRLSMTRCCISGLHEPSFHVSDLEISDRHETHTADTLVKLKDMYPGRRFYFIAGYDSLRALSAWYRPDIILANAVFLAASRDDHTAEDIRKTAADMEGICPGADIRVLACSEMPVSSTDIRARYAAGGDISAYVTKETLDFIKEHGLYRNICNSSAFAKSS